jgi:5'-methylthioadenosine phosphorylase
MWSIIGGSGFEKFADVENLGELDRETPFGTASSGLKRIKLGGQTCLFLSRHGEHHEQMPTEVNYRANIFALKRHGAKAILSFSAVGSLRADLKPGELVIPTQYIDRTKGIRAASFCGGGVVGHVSLAYPVCVSMAKAAAELSGTFDRKTHFGKTYVTIEGPHFSTLAESLHYRELGADIIGMTNFPEYALAREAGLPYLPCCFVTDYDCWDSSRPHVTLEEVLTVMRENNRKAFELAQKILTAPKPLYQDCECYSQGLKMGLMTPADQIPPKARKWLEVLIS